MGLTAATIRSAGAGSRQPSDLQSERGLSSQVGKIEIGKVMAKMVYGIVCFATLFSFIGTVLGGIWADQSWGRFWGWDRRKTARC